MSIPNYKPLTPNPCSGGRGSLNFQGFQEIRNPKWFSLKEWPVSTGPRFDPQATTRYTTNTRITPVKGTVKFSPFENGKFLYTDSFEPHEIGRAFSCQQICHISADPLKVREAFSVYWWYQECKLMTCVKAIFVGTTMTSSEQRSDTWRKTSIDTTISRQSAYILNMHLARSCDRGPASCKGWTSQKHLKHHCWLAGLQSCTSWVLSMFIPNFYYLWYPKKTDCSLEFSHQQ